MVSILESKKTSHENKHINKQRIHKNIYIKQTTNPQKKTYILNKQRIHKNIYIKQTTNPQKTYIKQTTNSQKKTYILNK